MIPVTEKLSIGEQMLEDAVAILKALADPNRLRIFDLLMQGDLCNYELKEKLGLPPNLLSHHLRVLRQAGLVLTRRDVIDGRLIYYVVKKKVVASWRAWLNEFLDPARDHERLVYEAGDGR